jgi:DNA polymerase-3 subunit chi
VRLRIKSETLPRIDFYVLSNQALNGRLLLACRLAEKAYTLKHKVYLHTESGEQGRQLDDLLWSFRQGSFVPHALYPTSPEDRSPVLIGWTETPTIEADILINITHTVPVFFERFQRVAELVDQHPDTLAKSRERFRIYRNRGYSAISHKL